MGSRNFPLFPQELSWKEGIEHFIISIPSMIAIYMNVCITCKEVYGRSLHEGKNKAVIGRTEVQITFYDEWHCNKSISKVQGEN